LGVTIGLLTGEEVSPLVKAEIERREINKKLLSEQGITPQLLTEKKQTKKVM
jgi:hypothetical protein